MLDGTREGLVHVSLGGWQHECWLTHSPVSPVGNSSAFSSMDLTNPRLQCDSVTLPTCHMTELDLDGHACREFELQHGVCLINFGWTLCSWAEEPGTESGGVQAAEGVDGGAAGVKGPGLFSALLWWGRDFGSSSGSSSYGIFICKMRTWSREITELLFNDPILAILIVEANMNLNKPVFSSINKSWIHDFQDGCHDSTHNNDS